MINQPRVGPASVAQSGLRLTVHCATSSTAIVSNAGVSVVTIPPPRQPIRITFSSNRKSILPGTVRLILPGGHFAGSVAPVYFGTRILRTICPSWQAVLTSLAHWRQSNISMLIAKPITTRLMMGCHSILRAR